MTKNEIWDKEMTICSWIIRKFELKLQNTNLKWNVNLNSKLFLAKISKWMQSSKGGIHVCFPYIFHVSL